MGSSAEFGQAGLAAVNTTFAAQADRITADHFLAVRTPAVFHHRPRLWDRVLVPAASCRLGLRQIWKRVAAMPALRDHVYDNYGHNHGFHDDNVDGAFAELHADGHGPRKRLRARLHLPRWSEPQWQAGQEDCEASASSWVAVAQVEVEAAVKSATIKRAAAVAVATATTTFPEEKLRFVPKKRSSSGVPIEREKSKKEEDMKKQQAEPECVQELDASPVVPRSKRRMSRRISLAPELEEQATTVPPSPSPLPLPMPYYMPAVLASPSPKTPIFLGALPFASAASLDFSSPLNGREAARAALLTWASPAQASLRRFTMLATPSRVMEEEDAKAEMEAGAAQNTIAVADTELEVSVAQPASEVSVDSVPPSTPASRLSPQQAVVVFGQSPLLIADTLREPAYEVRRRVSLFNRRRSDRWTSAQQDEARGRLYNRRRHHNRLSFASATTTTAMADALSLQRNAGRRHTLQPMDLFCASRDDMTTSGEDYNILSAGEEEQKTSLVSNGNNNNSSRESTVVVDVRTNLNIFGFGPPVHLSPSAERFDDALAAMGESEGVCEGGGEAMTKLLLKDITVITTEAADSGTDSSTDAEAEETEQAGDTDLYDAVQEDKEEQQDIEKGAEDDGDMDLAEPDDSESLVSRRGSFHERTTGLDAELAELTKPLFDAFTEETPTSVKPLLLSSSSPAAAAASPSLNLYDFGGLVDCEMAVAEAVDDEEGENEMEEVGDEQVIGEVGDVGVAEDCSSPNSPSRPVDNTEDLMAMLDAVSAEMESDRFDVAQFRSPLSQASDNNHGNEVPSSFSTPQAASIDGLQKFDSAAAAVLFSSSEKHSFNYSDSPINDENATTTLTLDLGDLSSAADGRLSSHDDSETEMLRMFVTRVRADKSAKAAAAAAATAAEAAATAAATAAITMATTPPSKRLTRTMKRRSGSMGSAASASGSPMSKNENAANRIPLGPKNRNMSPSPVKMKKRRAQDMMDIEENEEDGGENEESEEAEEVEHKGGKSVKKASARPKDLLSKPSLDDMSPPRPKRRRKKMEADTGSIFNLAFFSGAAVTAAPGVGGGAGGVAALAATSSSGLSGWSGLSGPSGPSGAPSAAPTEAAVEGPRRSKRTTRGAQQLAKVADNNNNNNSLSLIPVRLPGSLNLNGDDSSSGGSGVGLGVGGGGYGLLSTGTLSLRRTGEKDLAMVTRVNTRKNKGNAEAPCTVLARLSMKEHRSVFDVGVCSSSSSDEDGRASNSNSNSNSKKKNIASKTVRWAEVLARSQDADAAVKAAKAAKVARAAKATKTVSTIVAAVTATSKGLLDDTIIIGTEKAATTTTAATAALAVATVVAAAGEKASKKENRKKEEGKDTASADSPAGKKAVPKRTKRASRLPPPTPRKVLAAAASASLISTSTALKFSSSAGSSTAAAAANATASDEAATVASKKAMPTAAAVPRMATRRTKILSMGISGNGTPAPKRRVLRTTT